MLSYLASAKLGDAVRIVGAERMQLDNYTILRISATGDIDVDWILI